MKNSVKFLSNYLLLIGVILTGCGPVLYSNVGHNVPLLQEKGEFVGTLNFSSSSGAWTANGGAGKFGYALSDKIQVIGSFYAMSNVKDPENDEWEGNGTYWELGSGWYGAMENPKFRYEAILGLGGSKIKNSSLINRGEYINSSYLKPFFQPSLGFISRYFEAALTPRITYLTFTQSNDYRINLGDLTNSVDFFEAQNNKVVFEPGLTLRGGYEGVMLEIQYSYSFLKEHSDEYYLINNEFVSVGVRFLIGERDYSKINRSRIRGQ